MAHTHTGKAAADKAAADKAAAAAAAPAPAKDEGSTLYIGCLWAFRRETLALVYGIGTRF